MVKKQTQRAVIDYSGTESNYFQIISAPSQGTVLGPVIFIMHRITMHK